ncbi:GAF domain-containing protein [Bordetella genomosp. 1]|uniref:GAF domain-containing protein n=1 Tax=Bordetella genomosp. 1 TaxID=1395607 RepID=A0ABX4F2W6_9BORD|nr:GAF domain-containing protein [Bordetella genomosp. 1]OZI68098.1 GAF domain-containing protein [Bordetella genomosp. 1]
MTDAAAPLATAAALDRLCAAHAAGDLDAAFAAIDAFAAVSLSHRLCTANRFDAQAMRVVRLYSSNPQAYPPGGSKDKAGTPWGQRVLLDHEVFVGAGVDAIRAFFDDHDAIARLGLRSVINVPVVHAGQCLGTFNFLMPFEQPDASHVHAARLAGALALPLFLLERQRALA